MVLRVNEKNLVFPGRSLFAEGGETQPLSARILSRVLEVNQEATGRPASLPTRAEFQSLSRETDPELFLEAALALAMRLKQRNEISLSQTLLHGLLETHEALPSTRSDFSENLLGRIRRELDAMEGRGAIGPRLEFLFRRLPQEVANPITLASFFVGAGFFEVGRYAALARLTASPAANFLTRGLGARALSGLAGLALEAPAMTLTARGLHELFVQRQDWQVRAVGRDILATGMTLGFLRSGSSLAQGAFRGIHKLSRSMPAVPFQGVSRISELLLPQVAMFTSILLSHHAEVQLGWRQATDGPLALAESLVTLLQFNVASGLFHQLQPEAFREWRRGLEIRSEQLAHRFGEKRSSFHFGPSFFPGMREGAFAGWPSARRGFRPSPSPGEETRLLMTGKEEDPEAPPESPRTFSFINLRNADAWQVLEYVPLPVLVTDVKGDLLFVNYLAKEILWKGREGVMEGKLTDILRRISDDENDNTVKSPLEGNEGLFWELRSSALPWSEGQIAHFLIDRTQMRRLEADVDQLEADNARLAAQSELAQQYLHDAAHTLQDISYREQLLERLLVRFPPLSSLSSPPETEGPPSSRVRTVVSRLKELGSSIGTVLTLYRSAQRMMAGYHEIKLLSLEPLLLNALSLNEGIRVKQSIELKTDFAEEPLTIFGEEAPIMTSVLNLLVNACHAMPEGGVLTLRHYQRGSAAVIEVSDTGTGIAPEHLPRIFDLGFTTKGHSGGTGLGLHTVQWAVEKIHRGRVEVESTVGTGTTFRIYLPLPDRLPRK